MLAWSGAVAREQLGVKSLTHGHFNILDWEGQGTNLRHFDYQVALSTHSATATFILKHQSHDKLDVFVFHNTPAFLTMRLVRWLFITLVHSLNTSGKVPLENR